MTQIDHLQNGEKFPFFSVLFVMLFCNSILLKLFSFYLLTLFSRFLYLYQYIGSQVYPYLLIVVPALLKSVIFSIYYTKLKRKMNPNLQLERKYLNTLTDPIAQSESKLFHSGKFLYDKWRGQYDKNFKTYLTADKRFVHL